MLAVWMAEVARSRPCPLAFMPNATHTRHHRHDARARGARRPGLSFLTQGSVSCSVRFWALRFFSVQLFGAPEKLQGKSHRFRGKPHKHSKVLGPRLRTIWRSPLPPSAGGHPQPGLGPRCAVADGICGRNHSAVCCVICCALRCGAGAVHSALGVRSFDAVAGTFGVWATARFAGRSSKPRRTVGAFVKRASRDQTPQCTHHSRAQSEAFYLPTIVSNGCLKRVSNP